ncbi:long-chain fatty acid--CoA ligase [Lactiplantibacillus pentosus]|jgi:acyl-CoA synthetase|uniref:class I adenylate-forming enzyme family protein n=1 Tax=Lactiplantibacillus pentosus TaxID=1589 RepID=UPI000EAACD58|nr:class I adenylate-forming enzyme family protein [Lactiplantibacillus pentosus]AYG38699.1 long-chain fatty acid--CoA ligase [Lactiplantibacillus pentosus]AYG41359.1 long-chain fatty acid--CoA ligase [Lactiplantibacillus pentosus]MCB5220106.1 acyl--CoA ligase [Lactiplantibacillus pentosus]MCJ8181432.1 acyl--CoA ligase [Lactiplantibacillus pentosus]MCT3288856.1 long-chain fatty acid--CoA ligase [Lactiplantibacillus pentosus]
MANSDELLTASAFPMTIAALWNQRCRQTPQHTFLIQNKQRYSYEDVDQLSEEAGDMLDAYGLVSGDVVAIQLATNVTAIQLFIACFKRGLTILPLNPHLDDEETSSLIKKMAPTVIITKSDGCNSLSFNNQLLNDYNKHIVRLGQTDLQIMTDEHHRTEMIAGNSPAVILCTSGTTGAAKGVMLTNQNILYSELQFNRIYGIQDSDVQVLPSGLYHALGFHHGLISTILAGSTLVLIEHYSPDTLKRAINDYGCTYLVTVPTVIFDIFEWSTRPKSLRFIISGGAPLGYELLRTAWKLAVPVYNIYGLTECVPFVCTSPAYYQMKEGQLTGGYPIDGMSVAILNNQHQKITQTNQEGRIMAKGPVVFSGYYHDQERTDQVLSPDGWLDTGDIGHWNADHALEVDGRSKDIIIRGGENIPAYVVERELQQYPNIKEAAAVGIKDKRLGELIGAFVVLSDPNISVTLQQVKQFLAEHNVVKKIWPERLIIVDKLPKTSSGKAKKRVLIAFLKSHPSSFYRPMHLSSGDDGWGVTSMDA